jgi:hypothetical protein
MARHRAGCLCRVCESVREYRLAREAAEVAREYATGGYATEMTFHAPIITFKQWLQDMAHA